jgi:sporulation protein YlmC with PRC-barrel domain
MSTPAPLRFDRLTHLEDIRVRTEDGTRLGHVFELRSNGAAETEPTYEYRTVDCLLCGRLGLFERLGWRERDAIVVPWERVISVGAREIVVRGSKEDYKRI